MKWEMPFCSGDSRREPLEIQTPMETDRTCDMDSVMTLMPLGRVVMSMSRSRAPGVVRCLSAYIEDNSVPVPFVPLLIDVGEAGCE